MRKYILLLILNALIWGIVALELAYYEPCSANPPPARLYGQTLSVALHSTISV